VAKRAAGASEAHAAQAAREVLAQGNAVDAVIAGVLAAAAESPGVMLGPVQILVGGPGAGLRAVDGRVRQPGLGVARPRGLVAGEPVPAPSLVGVPALPAALAAVHASLGSASLLRTATPAIERARAVSAERARVVEAFARRGAGAFTDEALVGELTAVAGRAASGLLTHDDLAAVRPAVVACDERALGPSGVLLVPWRAQGAALDASAAHVVAAADTRGILAVGCYEAPLEGVAVPALGLVAPAFAAPVMRGEPRVRPGEPRPAAAPIALRAKRGVADLALGIAQAAAAEESLAAIIDALEEAPTVADALSKAPSGRAVAVVRTREIALVVAG
jgi:gamma-glutamyltranspeptidase/glutathione hydrolase